MHNLFGCSPATGHRWAPPGAADSTHARAHVLTAGHAAQLMVRNEVGAAVPAAAVEGGARIDAARFFSPTAPGRHTMHVRAAGCDLAVPPAHVEVDPDPAVRPAPTTFGRFSVPLLLPPAVPQPAPCRSLQQRSGPSVTFNLDFRIKCISFVNL